MVQRKGTHESCTHDLCWREGHGILGWASLFSALAKMLPSKFITYQCVGWVGETEDVPIIRKSSRSIVQTLRDIIKEREEEEKKPFIEHICFQAVQKEELSSVLSALIEKYFHTSTSWLIFHAVMFPPVTFWCGFCAAAGRSSFNPSQAPDNVKGKATCAWSAVLARELCGIRIAP